MGNRAGMEKVLLTRNPRPRPCLYPHPTSIYAGMRTRMMMVLRAGMGTVKQSPTPPRPIAIPNDKWS